MTFHHCWRRPTQNSTAPLARPTAASRARPKCNATPDLLEHPMDWVWAYADKRKEPPSWWPEFWPLYRECTGRLTNVCVQEIVRRQVVAFRLPASQAERLGWWAIPPSLPALCCNTFLPPKGLVGSWDIWETRKERTLGDGLTELH